MSIPPSQDDRVKVSPGIKARMKAKGLQFDLPEGPLTVVMEDEIIHTVAFPVCDRPGCCCYYFERIAMMEETAKPKRRTRRRKIIERTYPSTEAALAAPLNGNAGFQLMR